MGSYFYLYKLYATAVKRQGEHMDEAAKKAAAEALKTKEEADAAEAEKKEPKTFSQEDFDKQLSKTLADKEAKLEKKLSEKFDKELSERERLAKLSAEEKDGETRKKRDAEQADREREITLRENRADARELLQSKNISSELVDFVVDVDADKTKDNIDNLEKAFLKAVEDGVAEKLKGKTPETKKPEVKNDHKSTADLLYGRK